MDTGKTRWHITFLRMLERRCHNRWLAGGAGGMPGGLVLFMLPAGAVAVVGLYSALSALMLYQSGLVAQPGFLLLLLAAVLLHVVWLLALAWLALGGARAFSAVRGLLWFQLLLCLAGFCRRLFGDDGFRNFGEMAIAWAVMAFFGGWLLYFRCSSRLARLWNRKSRAAPPVTPAAPVVPDVAGESGVSNDPVRAARPGVPPAPASAKPGGWLYVLALWMGLRLAALAYQCLLWYFDPYARFLGMQGVAVTLAYAALWLYALYALLAVKKRAVTLLCLLLLFECLLGVLSLTGLTYYALYEEPLLWMHALFAGLVEAHSPGSSLFWLCKPAGAWFFYLLLSRRVGAVWGGRYGAAAPMFGGDGAMVPSRFY